MILNRVELRKEIKSKAAFLLTAVAKYRIIEKNFHKQHMAPPYEHFIEKEIVLK